MKSLHLLRHAKSSWKDPGLNDHDRPLSKRGRQTAVPWRFWTPVVERVNGFVMQASEKPAQNRKSRELHRVC